MRIWNKSIGIGGYGFAASPSMGQDTQVTGSRIKAHVRFLSSDLLEGRGVGTRGGQLTEEYIAAQLAALGARPAGENGTYFQTVPMVGVQTQPVSQLRLIKDGKPVSFKWQDEFVGTTHRQQPETKFQAEAIFVGHGIVSRQEKWDDYKGVDVKGKLVVLFTNEPQPENPASIQRPHADLRRTLDVQVRGGGPARRARVRDHPYDSDCGLRLGSGAELVEQRRPADAARTWTVDA